MAMVMTYLFAWILSCAVPMSKATRVFVWCVFMAIMIIEWDFVTLSPVEGTIGLINMHVKMSGSMFVVLCMTFAFAIYKCAVRQQGGDYRVVQYAQVSDSDDEY